jgi:uncharacterized protein with von Willebrand factor type A (vWA) domain
VKLIRTAADDVPEKFATVRRELSAALIERDEEVDLALTALVAGEHVLLVGPPGSAKSLLLDSVLAATGGRKFSILLTKFSVPEEVCGAVSLTALKEDRYVRVTAGKLPEADFAFLDEVFKASSAILNTLLKILNERVYRGLHAATRLDDAAAAIAAAHFAEQFARLRTEDREKGVDRAASAGDDLGGEISVLRAVGRAVAEAGQEVEELRDAATALGLGPGAPGSGDPAAVAALFKRVRADASLRRICELAGRFRRVAQSKQRMKATHGLDDVVGVEPGGDVGRLLPSELARLMIPELELDTLRRIAERQALCREHHAVEPVGKGPVMVAVDESGSMEGEKVHTAKALALALAWVARRQRRWCGLVAYSGDSGERLLALPPGRWDEAALADWLTAFLGRGSSLDVPVRELPDYYRRLGAPPGVTDVVLITDAQARIPGDVAAAFNAWRRSVRARVTTLVIADPPGDLALVSDEVHQVRALAATEDAVGQVLSL